MGLAMGSTAIAIIYSPMGQTVRRAYQSGDNPDLFPARQGRQVGRRLLHRRAISRRRRRRHHRCVCCYLPGRRMRRSITSSPCLALGARSVAFAAEITITFVLMTVILHVSNHPKLHKFTGLCAGALVATYITVEAPISGMSMNPARYFGFGNCREPLDGPLGLLHSAADRHAVRSRGLHSAPRPVRAWLAPSSITRMPNAASSAASRQSEV